MDTSDETWTPFDFLFERISIETIAKEEEEEEKKGTGESVRSIVRGD